MAPPSSSSSSLSGRIKDLEAPALLGRLKNKNFQNFNCLEIALFEIFLGALQRGASSFHILPQKEGGTQLAFLSSSRLFEFFAYEFFGIFEIFGIFCNLFEIFGIFLSILGIIWSSLVSFDGLVLEQIESLVGLGLEQYF